MKILISLTLFCLMAVANAAGAQPLPLVRDHQSKYVISVAQDAIPAEKRAALQLQKYLARMTGATLPVLSEEAVAPASPRIVVGNGRQARTLLPKLEWNKLGRDAIVIQTAGQNLVLTGERPRGTLYAVYQFLEDLGCRFWAPNVQHIPEQATISVPPRQTYYVPPFAYRQHDAISVYNDDEFAVAMRMNADMRSYRKQPPRNSEWGGSYQILGWAHTFGQLLPVEKYFKDHPEWYSDPANGYKPATAASKMPVARKTDLCLSNPEVLDALTEQALGWIEKNPEAGYISISQNDNTASYCRDDAALKLIEEEGSPSAPLIKFVNAVAERIHQKYPDVLVETLAYLWSEKPPKTLRPAENVLIRLAPANSDFGNPLNSDRNAAIRDNLLAWSDKASQLFVWNYITNFYNMLMPHPNMTNWSSDLRFFAGNKVKGVFAQGNSKTNDVGDFAPLRTYVINKLLWDPSQDQDKLTSEFLQGYYGAAAPFLKQYLALIEGAYPHDKRGLYMYNRDFSYLTVEVLNRATALFDQAAAAVAQDAELSGRVARERFSLDLAWLMLTPHRQWENVSLDTGYAGPRDLKAALVKWKADADRFGVKAFTEGRPRGYISELIPKLEQAIQATPSQAQHYRETGEIVFTPAQFNLSKDYAALADDPLAGEGRAIRIKGDNTEWATQVWLGQWLPFSVLDNVTWKVTVRVRLDLKPGAVLKDNGLQTGIFDVENNRSVQTKPVLLRRLSEPRYYTIELKPAALHGGMFIWVAPDNNPAVEAVYVDQITLTRQ